MVDAAASPHPARCQKLHVMSDSQEFSEQIRRAAGFGSAPTDEGTGGSESKPGPEESPGTGDVDFGAGAGVRSTQPEPDMSAAIRAAAAGAWVRGGGVR
jgi:hypothetical protein